MGQKYPVKKPKTHPSTCSRKERFKTQRLAASVARDYELGQETYLCNVCLSWHLTSGYR